LARILELRAAVAGRYRELLEGFDGLELPTEDDDAHVRSWFVYVVALPEGTDRERVIARLAERGVQPARYLPRIHLQAYMRERYGFRAGLCRVAEGRSARRLARPFHARLGEGDQEPVVRSLREALGE